jgi:hypothetical protein
MTPSLPLQIRSELPERTERPLFVIVFDPDADLSPRVAQIQETVQAFVP